jgi:hypothetical protein
MKKLILIFSVILIVFSCNNDDDTPEPVIEEEPDLSFPDCLLNNDIIQYHFIMDYPPSEPRGHLLKSKYNGVEYYTFNVFSATDINVDYYTNNCEIFCTLNALGGGTDCSEDFRYNREQIGVVWTDPR